MKYSDRDEYYYLACPYTHELSSVRELRYMAVMECYVHLIKTGISIFSPICMTHGPHNWANENRVPISHSTWLATDHPFLIKSSGMFVLQLPGWEESKGVAWETDIINGLVLPIIYIPPDEYIKHWPDDLLNSSTDDVMMNTENKEQPKNA